MIGVVMVIRKTGLFLTTVRLHSFEARYRRGPEPLHKFRRLLWNLQKGQIDDVGGYYVARQGQSLEKPQTAGWWSRARTHRNLSSDRRLIVQLECIKPLLAILRGIRLNSWSG